MKISQYTEDKIRVRVHTHNEFKKLKDAIIKELMPLFKELENKEVLKVDGYLKKKYKDLLDNKLEEIKKKHVLKPLKNGYWIKLSYCYIKTTEYDISLKVSINLQTGEAKREGYGTPNEYKEFYIYLSKLTTPEGTQDTWGFPINKKISVAYELKPEEILNADEQIKQAEKVSLLKSQYEEEKAKLQPYNIKELV